jgi:hypothetical protein|tara:strand:+ start:1187 stop:1348 length:162 start_codon:yes stop_codon:yes gene_type:complete
MIKKIKKSEYSNLYECIKSDQVPANAIAEYFQDKDFFKYVKKREKNNDKRSTD